MAGRVVLSPLQDRSILASTDEPVGTSLRTRFQEQLIDVRFAVGDKDPSSRRHLPRDLVPLSKAADPPLAFFVFNRRGFAAFFLLAARLFRRGFVSCPHR